MMVHAVTTAAVNGQLPALCVGIGGSLSGRRAAHAPAFLATGERLSRADVVTIVGDDASQPLRARALAESFVQRGVHAVIGHFNSACAREVLPVYRAAGVAVLLPAASDSTLHLGAGAYRMCADDLAQARAIVSWLRAHHVHEQWLEVRIDGSDYSHRLVQALRATVGSTLTLDVRGTAEDDVTERVCIVCAVAHHASEWLRRARVVHGRTTIILSDEAAVIDVARVAAERAPDSWIVTPSPSYETLLLDSAELMLRWQQERAHARGLVNWLERCGRFLPAGESTQAGWELLPSRDLCSAVAVANTHTNAPTQRREMT